MTQCNHCPARIRVPTILVLRRKTYPERGIEDGIGLGVGLKD